MTPKPNPLAAASQRVTIACVLVVAGVMSADANVKKIQITMKQSPAFSGYSWPGVGQYEKIVGKAFGELDPRDPKNSVICGSPVCA